MEGIDQIKFELSQKLSEAVKTFTPRMRSLIAREMNKGLTESRREIVEKLIANTGLKRKVLNDRIVIGRASPDSLTGRITPLFGRRVYMSDYPYSETVARGNRKVIRLEAQIYRKNMRTGFMSADGKRMYLRSGENPGANNKAGSVRAVWGRSIPRLFEHFGIKEAYEIKIASAISERVETVMQAEVFK